MSCESCNSCFRGSSSDTTSLLSLSPQKSIPDLLRTAKSQLFESSLLNHTVADITNILSQNCYPAFAALVTSYESLNPQEFLDLVDLCLKTKLKGPLIAWAWQSVKEDPKQLIIRLKEADEELVGLVNEQAEVFEVFNPGLKMGRMEIERGKYFF